MSSSFQGSAQTEDKLYDIFGYLTLGNRSFKEEKRGLQKIFKDSAGEKFGCLWIPSPRNVLIAPVWCIGEKDMYERETVYVQQGRRWSKAVDIPKGHRVEEIWWRGEFLIIKLKNCIDSTSEAVFEHYGGGRWKRVLPLKGKPMSFRHGFFLVARSSNKL